MDEFKPIALWARVASGLIVGIAAMALVGLAWMVWHDGKPPRGPWPEWVIGVISGWVVVPLFLSVALKGDVSWGKPPSREPRFGKLKTRLGGVYLVVLLFVGFRYEPLATEILAILLGALMVGVGLHIYFMPIKAKLAAIAKIKARYGIPSDQPHRVDETLKSGFFRIR